MASIISLTIAWILAIAQYYFAAATLSFIVLTFAKAMRNFNDQFLGEETQPTTKKKRECDNKSLAPIKMNRTARAISNSAEAIQSAQNDTRAESELSSCHRIANKSIPLTNERMKTMIGTTPAADGKKSPKVSGHSLASSQPKNENNGCPYPPDLVDEDTIYSAPLSSSPPSKCPKSQYLGARQSLQKSRQRPFYELRQVGWWGIKKIKVPWEPSTEHIQQTKISSTPI